MTLRNAREGNREQAGLLLFQGFHAALKGGCPLPPPVEAASLQQAAGEEILPSV